MNQASRPSPVIVKLHPVRGSLRPSFAVALAQDLLVTQLDVLEWRLLVDSPIDASKLAISPTNHYTAAEGVESVTDEAGNFLTSAKGEKNGFRYDYLKALRYDKFEQRVLMAAGNGIETAYTYNAQTRRLSNLTAGKATGNLFQNLVYAYDPVGNVLGLDNQVGIPPASSYGGPTSQRFAYDDLYRLTHAEGSFQFAPDKTHTYSLDLGYDSIHNIQTKMCLSAESEADPAWFVQDH